MSDLPHIFGCDPLKLLAEEASPKMIHDWIDRLYEADFNEGDWQFPFQLYTVAALSKHIRTYPPNIISELTLTRDIDIVEQHQAIDSSYRSVKKHA